MVILQVSVGSLPFLNGGADLLWNALSLKQFPAMFCLLLFLGEVGGSGVIL